MPIWFYIQRYLPIILIAAVVVGLLLGVQRQARKKGLEIDFLSPSGDPTRHILASLVLRGAVFRTTIIRQLRNPFLARAAEPCLDMPLIQAAAQRIEAEARPAQWAIVLSLLVIVLLIPIKLKLSFLFFWVAFCVYLQFRDRFQQAPVFDRQNYNPDDLRTKYGVGAPVTFGGTPTLVSGVFNPFLGLGLNLGGWNIALDVSRPAEGKDKTKPLTAAEVEQDLTDAILNLSIPNLTIVDRLLISGVETVRVPEVQPEPFQAPAREVSAPVVAEFRGHPDDRARVYRFATITSFGGEVVVSYGFRVLKRGSALGVEVVHLAAAPLAPKYREIDFLRTGGFFTGLFWLLGAIAMTPARFLGAFVSILAQIGELWDEVLGGHIVRERREIQRNPAYNYGARWSLRTFTASPNYNNWFQKADVQQYLRGLEEQVLNAFRDCLEAHDVDVRNFANQSMTVHNNNVQITSNRDVNLQGVAFGQGAKAVSVMGRLGLGSKKKDAA